MMQIPSLKCCETLLLRVINNYTFLTALIKKSPKINLFEKILDFLPRGC